MFLSRGSNKSIPELNYRTLYLMILFTVELHQILLDELKKIQLAKLLAIEDQTLSMANTKFRTSKLKKIYLV